MLGIIAMFSCLSSALGQEEENSTLAKQMVGVTESVISNIAYHPNGTNDSVGVKGTIVEPNGLLLRRHTDEGGLVVFMDKNPHDDWSFSYTFENVPLTFPHIGGVYMWYTDSLQDQGLYRGGHDMFKGIMVGLEFRGSQPEIVMASNDGEGGLRSTEDATLYRDTINPARLKNVKEITVKVISTHKNFKVELYNGDKLLYDHFRYYNKTNLGERGAGGYFSITSFYDKAPSEKVYKLLSAQLYSRHEGDAYKIHEVHSGTPSNVPRSPNDVEHENEEIRQLVSKVEYLSTYLHLIVGDPHDSAFDKVVALLNQDFKSTERKIDELLNVVKNYNGSENVGNRINSFNEKINELDLKAQRLQKSMSEVLHHIQILNDKGSQKSNLLTYCVLGVGLSAILLMGIREYNSVKFRQKII